MTSAESKMMTSNSKCELNESGYILFFTLMILVIMAVAGATMTGNTLLESTIVRNASQRTLNFYAAESAAMEAGQRLESEDDPVRLATYNEPWLNDNSASSSDKLAVITTDWDFDGTEPDNASTGIMSNSAFTTVRVGVAKSAELGMENETLLYEYTMLGRTFEREDPTQVVAMVECGFLKRH